MNSRDVAELFKKRHETFCAISTQYSTSQIRAGVGRMQSAVLLAAKLGLGRKFRLLFFASPANGVAVKGQTGGLHPSYEPDSPAGISLAFMGCNRDIGV